MSSVIGEDIFYYGLYSESSQKLMAAKLISGLPKNYFLDSDHINKLLDSEKLTMDHISKIHTAFSTEHFSLLPKEIEPVNLADFAESFTGLYHDDQYEMEKSSIDELNARFYYMAPKILKQSIEERFSLSVFCHFNASLLKGITDRPGDFIFYNFLNDRLQTFVVKKGELLQSNQYVIHGKDDALYFALLNCHNFDFDPEKDQFLLAGTLPEESPQIMLFNRHFNKLELIGNRDRLHYANAFLGKPKHLFFDLDCVRSCE